MGGGAIAAGAGLGDGEDADASLGSGFSSGFGVGSGGGVSCFGSVGGGGCAKGSSCIHGDCVGRRGSLGIAVAGTTGAGFCYNIGRIAAAAASIVFGLHAPVGDFRGALLWVSAIAAAAALCSCWLPERTHENEAT